MLCDYCHLDAAKLYRTEEEERVCRLCWHDLLYCRMGGRIPQEPRHHDAPEMGSEAPSPEGSETNKETYTND